MARKTFLERFGDDPRDVILTHPPPRVLVCGGRNYGIARKDGKMTTQAGIEHARLVHELNHIERTRGIACIITGAAPGADSLAAMWARRSGIKVVEFPADWQKHGMKAGPIRNSEIINKGKPTLAIAFPGSRGTADMVSRIREAGIELIEVK